MYGVLFYDAWQSGKLINFLIILLIVVVACLWVWLSFWLCRKANQEKEAGLISYYCVFLMVCASGSMLELFTA